MRAAPPAAYGTTVHGIPRSDEALARTYHDFAVNEAAGRSPAYERLCRAVSADAEVLALLGTLPLAKRQPNLLLGAVRLLGGPVDDYPAFRGWLLEHWPAAREQMLARSTQTNEAARCALLLPVLAALPQPLALLEVGASAGLCLYPDRFRYRYGDRDPIGPAGGPLLACTVDGPTPVPDRLPHVVWRAGIDLNPLDVTDPADVRWLESLIWPEHHDRRERLTAAAAIAAADPPLLVRGDLNEALPRLAEQAPAAATLVVFHTAVLAYLDAAGVDRFTGQLTELTRRRPGTVWLSNEAPRVVPQVADRLPRPAPPGRFVLAVDGRPVAFTMPHGQGVDWL
ncbi:DUF2332 domain-containing protein [Catellatospora coxensis]|uniref:DUF2332 domain-containing protein n=1 Tax=Catellatospora coxensis TaxID=310354 RepID=A0A8J3P7M0_9ACTN|nr:hypothetical protein Cco03nite_34520 [Catellatospora coxensis]